ncbi:dihydroneopterin aldolase [Epibacterium ulvae]|uniref:dihydroneopterin aldolase n=1 Tax=Epibacterium ulvae TaxID=1156985 RepID=A0A1G5R4H4_9RHOB|nr:dihydroneopterin aldolase [Epibacterium ulvae]SCZ68758.1 dihydroneopterin aldolase [Epibacterium ulvae]
MSSEIRLAFEHPDERSRATAGQPLDRLSVRDHLVEVEIGAFQAERGTTQRICFNIVVEIEPLPADLDDDVDRILSYDRVTEAIAHELAAERLNLLETLAERIAERILTEPQAVRAFVRIEKLDRGPGALGVEIVRAQDQVRHVVHEEEVPHPRLMYLSNAAIDSVNLAGWIDQMECRERPLILCVGRHDQPMPQTGHKMTQRRIDLLAIEQNAWRLASKDNRCVVVSTRTELDWAMKNGQICVWAPSKVVLDAVDSPAAASHDAVQLAAWFAATFEAGEMIVIDEALPEDPSVPLRAVKLEQTQL